MPHHQGALDGLCGAYSVVNAMKVIREDNSEESRALFKEIVRHLNEKKNLADIMLDGMTIGTLYGIINDIICSEHVKRKMPFRGSSKVSPGELWDTMEKFMNEPDNGLCAIIVPIFWSEESSHWSVVKKITNKTIILEDSDGMKRISRSRVTCCDPKGKKLHRINPREIIFLNNPHVE